ncbi:MAG: DUF4136 domain-containing protein [Kiritimatiellales bacterium]|nr:DUF4136 domain-containing protein [Kiritimatiellales bacterium]
MDTKYGIVAIALLIVTAGCSTVRVKSEQNADYHFKSAKTYQWVAASENGQDGTPVLNGFYDQVTRNAISDELKKKGLTPAPEGTTPDLKLSYSLKFEERMDIDITDGEGDPRYSGGFYYNKDGGIAYQDNGPEHVNYAYDKGTATILLLDANTNDRVWRGVTETKVYRMRSPEKKEQKIRAAVEELFVLCPVSSRTSS